MPRILIVDDEQDILHLISFFLAGRNYQVQTAKSKEEFFIMLPSFNPDLIILDVMLGAENGRDICQEIKAAEHKHIPVILCSAMPEMLENYEDCGANKILEKPFPLSLLYEAVRTLLGAH